MPPKENWEKCKRSLQDWTSHWLVLAYICGLITLLPWIDDKTVDDDKEDEKIVG